LRICENDRVVVSIGTLFEFSGLDTYPEQFPLILKETPDAKLVISTRLPGVTREFGEDNGIIYVHEPQEVIATALELARSGKVEHEGAKARRFVENMGWDSVVDKFETALNDIIVGSPGSK
jgi:hypothetical protein